MKRSRGAWTLGVVTVVVISLRLGIVDAQESSDPLRAAFVKRIDEEKRAIGVLAGLLTRREALFRLTGG